MLTLSSGSECEWLKTESACTEWGLDRRYISPLMARRKRGSLSCSEDATENQDLSSHFHCCNEVIQGRPYK